MNTNTNTNEIFQDTTPEEQMLRVLEDMYLHLKKPNGRIYASGYIFEEEEEAHEVIRRVLEFAGSKEVQKSR